MAAAGRTLLGIGFVVTLGLGPAGAQMVLPGAVDSTPAGSSSQPAPPGRPRVKPPGTEGGRGGHPARGTAVTVPGAATLAGRTLSLDGGSASQIAFAAADKSIVVAKLTLAGEKISNALDPCRLEASPTPIALTRLERPDGLDRLRVEFAACPVTFDVLDGAILVGAGTGCDFVQADCRVRITGLWGPAPAEIAPERVRSLERARGIAEAAVRSNYKALVASTKDRPTIMDFARDQAQFSSSRAETCRDYADEGRHGYCATKLTEARAALLHDRLGTALLEKVARKAKRRGGKQASGDR